ncbi:MAG TPA: hypothetical protein VFQ86_05950 [Arachidicoccus soli]|nr:hypothetical protein [Arachidicoccus soli]
MTHLQIDSFTIEGMDIRAIAIPEGENPLSDKCETVEIRTLPFWLAKYAGYENDTYRFFFEKTEKEIRDYLQAAVNEYEEKYPVTFRNSKNILIL